MKLSKVQIEVLKKLFTSYENQVGKTNHHPQDAFKQNTLNALEKKGLVSFYEYENFLNGAVRITEEGKKQLRKNTSLLEEMLKHRKLSKS